jgi:hypothetical protein
VARLAQWAYSKTIYAVVAASNPAFFSFTQPVPPTEEMQGVFFKYGKFESVTAPRQKAATSARIMEPAWPSMTLMIPVGAPSPSPPGLTMQYLYKRVR